MDLQALEKALIAGEFRGWYLNGGSLSETYTISKTAQGWEVYYSERGQKTNRRVFACESYACQYFLDTISGNNSAKM